MTTHAKLNQWVDEVAALCKPDRVHWCDGSQAEYQEMLRLLVQSGTAIWMNPEKRPNSIFVRSTPDGIKTFESARFKDVPTLEPPASPKRGD